jgi:hypothetical protein
LQDGARTYQALRRDTLMAVNIAVMDLISVVQSNKHYSCGGRSRSGVMISTRQRVRALTAIKVRIAP